MTVATYVLANGPDDQPRVCPARCKRCTQTERNWSMAGPSGKDCYWQCNNCGQIRVMSRSSVLRMIRRAQS